CASACPCSAAYCSEERPFSFSPALSACAPVRKASTGVSATGALGVRVPSSAALSRTPKSTQRPSASPKQSSRLCLKVRIGDLLGFAARMGHRAADSGTDLLGVFPQITGGRVARARLPCGPAFLQFVVGKLHAQKTALGVEFDDVAVLQE